MRQAARVAVLGCIHGNLPALEAVLAAAHDADTVVLLGDIAAGPMPTETLDVLAALGARAVWVHGNAERELVTAYDGGEVTGPAADVALASAALLDERRIGLLRDLALTVTLDIKGIGHTVFCHATPAPGTGSSMSAASGCRTHRPICREPRGHCSVPTSRCNERGTTFVDEAIARIEADRFVGAARWAEDYVRRHYSDDEAVGSSRRRAPGVS